MPFVVPTGRLSQVVHGAEEYQLQTEFSLEPEPRITTTIVRGGQILKRINSPWGSGTLTDEDQRAVEKAIRRQHDSLLLELKHVLRKRDEGELVKKEAAEEVSGEDAAVQVEEESAQAVAASPSDVFGPTAARPAVQPSTAAMRVAPDVPRVVAPEPARVAVPAEDSEIAAVRLLEGVVQVYDIRPGFTGKGMSEQDVAWAGTVKRAVAWGNRLAELSRLGSLESCLGEYANANLLIFERRGRTIGVRPSPDVDLKQIVNDVRNVLGVE